MAKVFTNSKMDHCILVSGLMVFRKGKVAIDGLMVIDIEVILKMGKCMKKELLHGIIRLFTRVISLKIG